MEKKLRGIPLFRLTAMQYMLQEQNKTTKSQFTNCIDKLFDDDNVWRFMVSARVLRPS